jgi:lysophospholipase L1-like esterase
MPDRERALEAPAGTIRIAFLGESWTAGWGVEAPARYPDLLEAFLERGRSAQVRYEALNFSIPGISPVLHLRFLAGRVLPFHPDVVFLVVTPSDVSRAALDAARLLHEGIDLPSPALRAIAGEAGARPGRAVSPLERRLAPHAARLLRASIGAIRAACAEARAAFAVVLLPRLLGEGKPEPERETIASACAETATTLLDLADAFEGGDEERLVVASWDPHPNEEGHALLDRSLRRAIARSPEICARLRRRPEELDR